MDKYKIFFESSADAMMTIEDGVFIDCNPSMIKMLGYDTKEDVVGTTPDEISPPLQPDGKTSSVKAAEMLEIAFREGTNRFDWMHRDKNGKLFPVEVLLIKVPEGEKKLIKVVWHDISIRYQLQETLVKAELENQAKTDFLSLMSHELRTPLNAIIGFSESMKHETFGPVGSDKNREYLDDIHQSGHHLLELINDILDVSAIEASALDLYEENLSLTDSVEASVRLLRPRADNGQVSVTSTIDPEIPLIYADARRVKQVFL
ncbi:MAG: PAS domain S-box protein, partial [Rhodospirillales bacterium]|nr:PAS domain S-box protein [Rhodospirillales bacterium]